MVATVFEMLRLDFTALEASVLETTDLEAVFEATEPGATAFVKATAPEATPLMEATAFNARVLEFVVFFAAPPLA